MSQWAIDGVGKSGEIFKHMKKATERNIRMNVLFNSHADADMDTGYSPHDLLKNQKFDQQVCIMEFCLNFFLCIFEFQIGRKISFKKLIRDSLPLPVVEQFDGKKV